LIARNTDGAAPANAGDKEAALEESFQTLLDAKIITAAKPAAAAHSAPHILATSSLMATSFSKPPHPYRPKTMFILARAMTNTRLHLRRGDFGLIAADLVRRKNEVTGNGSATCAGEVTELFRVFRWLRLWSYTAAGACLFDSLVASEFFLRHRIPTTLYLGVQSKPFGAHAWVQWHDVVVNDTVENVRRYTPIMSI
jgi:hypothetical protein